MAGEGGAASAAMEAGSAEAEAGLRELRVADGGGGSADPGAQARYSRRTLVRAVLAGGVALAGRTLVVGGWVKTGREQGKGAFAFLELNDGSCPANLQVIVEAAVAPLERLTATGTALLLEGRLVRTPEGTRQPVELRAERVLEVGPCDASAYPVAKTKFLSLEFLRSIPHLRSRSNTIAAVARVRNALAYATHRFFQDNGFLYVQTPIITTSDCEGAGEMFQVTTLLGECERRDREDTANPPPTLEDVEALRAVVARKGEAVKELKERKAEKAEVKAAVEELNAAKDELGRVADRARRKPGLPRLHNGNFDYSEDFFARQAFLTVSGQLQVETYACALSSVYTFGPTFRAENSHTTRHLAEFWMIEPEIAFADLEDDMNCAEDYVRYLCQYLLDHCLDDMQLFADKFDKEAVKRLEAVAGSPFRRITYTEAIELLKKVTNRKFENKVEWGIDLASEHERYLAEEVFKQPLIVYNYPKDIKAFYMRLNDDGKTVAAMDILCPKASSYSPIGELIGGSQREERLEVLEQRLAEMGLPKEPYEWYLDTRRFGTVKHAGFGLGFERMVLFVTGIENIRDVIPFPRYPGKADL
eukprot:SM000249S08241  [mRNA]  locus=s249:154446:158274:+ [translate_table: standard]